MRFGVKVDFEAIATRKATLERARTELKTHFVGIDDTIDSLLDYIQIWYLLPDILTRPIIVNLWGMTGVGKTDLVRRLVKILDFQDRFTEVELSNIDSTSWSSSVAAILNSNGSNDSKPAIVLFDEIQRFNTLNPDGTPIQSTKFTDFWELLSDGKLSKRERDNLDAYLQSYIFQQKDLKRRKARGEEGIDENPMLNLYEAQDLKGMLQIDMDVEAMTDLSQMQMLDLIQQAKRKKQIYEPVDHSKTLILISGNLDEAFHMANQISEADIDADIFHAFTQKITIVDIKNALSRKFRPEQVARFGNIHLIYRSLKKVNFEQLIAKEIEHIIEKTFNQFGIVLKVHESIHQLVYRNGVFPVQGVRPVFSSIVDILETNLSKFLFTALMGQHQDISIYYDFSSSHLCATIGTHEERLPFVGRIDQVRNSNLEDTIANISVHESGHAVAYMMLFGLAPLQLKSKVASSYASGFTFPHQIHETEQNLIYKIQIYLAGGVAEELVFGKGNASIGRSHDREQATALAVDYIRKYGFNPKFQANYVLEYGYALDKYQTDKDVESMLGKLCHETHALLEQNLGLLQSLSLKLAAIGSLTAPEVAAIALEQGITVAVKEEGYLQIPAYQDLLF
jgi:Peptidase family M41/ATPase family associated with various cellular activities (AAA)